MFTRMLGRLFCLIVFFCVGCADSEHAQQAPPTKPPPRAEKPSAAGAGVAVELAPFDRYPYTEREPLVFRFKSPAAPANRTAAQNFEALALVPARPGTWRWDSDSALQFAPLDPWRPKDRFAVSLKGLITSDGSAQTGPAPLPETINVELPEATVGFSRCDFEIKNRAPLIQVPQVGLRFNYGVSSDPKDFLEMKIKRGTDEERLEQNITWSAHGLTVGIEGPKIFRPETPGTVVFRVKSGLPLGNGGTLEQGAECAIALDPARWDELADKSKEPPVERPITEVSVSPPTQSTYGTGQSGVLQLNFHAPWSTKEIPHGKAKGLKIEQGIVMYPPVEGSWQADENNTSRLTFSPKGNWPVGIDTKVTIDPNIFPAIQLRTTEVTFKTPPITAQLGDAGLYTDPHDPKRRKVTATVTLSHQPKAGEIERLLSVRWRVEPQKTFDRELKFTVTADPEDPKKAYIKSEDIELPDEPGEAHLQLSAGLVAAEGGNPTGSAYTITTEIPSKRDIFRIASSTVSIVKRDDERLVRVLSIESSEPISAEALSSSMEVMLLPDCEEKKYAKLCKDETSFGDEAKIFPEVLEKSEKVAFAAIPRDESTAPNLFHFSFEAPGSRELFIRFKAGLQSNTKFSLADDYRSVLFLEDFPRMLSIMHTGSLLSLSGDKELGVSLRNVPNVTFELARVLPRDVHHLVSATYGNFGKPYFNSSSFGFDQFSERFSYSANFPNRAPGETVYGTVEFNRFLSSGETPRGLFQLSVKEKKDKKQAEQEQAEYQECVDTYGYGSDEEGGQTCTAPQTLEDERLVLLTDLGLLVKDSLAGEHDVFVVSFRSGLPVAGATVKLLGQNGMALFTETSKADGRVHFPATDKLQREQVPLLYTVERGDDYSFLPFRRSDRYLNFSRFDTGGVMNSEESDGLRAMVFSDRGIYRPGEKASFGIMVRRRNLELAGEKLPLELSLTDPRGIEIMRKKFALSRLGFDDFNWSAENALTGTYTLGIYLIRPQQKSADDKRALLGSTSFRVDEFQPDKLSVKSSYVEEDGAVHEGWSPRSGTFAVTVKNLFGTPAVGNNVEGTLAIRPWDGTFAAFPDYRFYKPQAEAELPQEPENLGQEKTNAEGLAEFYPDLARFSERAFRLEFAGEAFEKDAGRSVVNSTAALVSDAAHFLGWKADGALDYVAKGAGRKVSLRGVLPDLKQTALNNLKMELEETRMISALVKQPNGLLAYQMTPKKSIVSTEALSVPEAGSDLMLKTAQPGDFTLKFIDEDGTELNSVHYIVHGEGNTTFMSDRSAEVGIKLSRSSVQPGEELEISINTPYTGSGLITIERDKVYAAKWFKSDTLSSVQTITIPQDVVGNAYISVAFVRSMESKDIFASPLSYGTKPFTIARSRYTEGVKLDVPEKVAPGQKLAVHYKLDDKAKVLLYAVDEGILQFARYRNPEPVSTFMPKRALEVQTYQILDLLLPDRRIVESLSSPGGDEDVGLGKFKNPFARKRRAPMAFWSGMIAEGALEGTVEIPVPEYFNGTIRILAMAVTEKKVGLQAASSISQSHFVIDPQMPYVVSPGDEFEVGATVANTVKGSGKDVKLKLQLEPSSAFEAIDAKDIELTVPEGEDRSFRMKLKAKDMLGEQELRFNAEGLGKSSSATESISLRPPRALRTSLQAGVYRPDKDGEKALKLLPVSRELYPDRREVTASISATPLSIGRALVEYLKQYPYGCTEQLVSIAFPAVLFGADPEMGLSEKDVETFTRRAFQTLSSRQRADGSFGLWDATTPPDVVFSVYATHFLLEARNHSLDAPSVVFDRALQWLKQFGAEPKYDLYSQLAQAYALYVRALNGEVVSKEAKTLRSDLDRQWQKSWRESAIALFLSGTFKKLQMDAEADELLKRPAGVWKGMNVWPLNDAVLYGSIYAYISAAQFGEDKQLSPLDAVLPVAQMIEDKSFYSFNSALVVMGLHAMSLKSADVAHDTLKIDIEDAAKAFSPLELLGSKILRGLVPDTATQLRYTGQDNKMFFYELSETGFDRADTAPETKGLEINRELKNEKGEIESAFALTDKVEVTLFIKASEQLSRMAVLELVPGGFEIDLSDEGLAQRKSLHPGPNTWTPQFLEIQEDRLIFFGDLPRDTVTFTYRLKPLSRGKFTVPAAYAEGMYDLTKRFIGTPSSIVVE